MVSDKLLYLFGDVTLSLLGNGARCSCAGFGSLIFLYPLFRHLGICGPSPYTKSLIKVAYSRIQYERIYIDNPTISSKLPLLISLS